MKSGFVDWIISTGANLYHDTHFGIGLTMHQGLSNVDDVVLREQGIVRIFDIFFDYDVLLSTDAFFRRSSRARVQRRCFRVPLGRRTSRRSGAGTGRTLLGAAYESGVPSTVVAGDSHRRHRGAHARGQTFTRPT
jgi:deoxyhypusine synthase